MFIGFKSKLLLIIVLLAQLVLTPVSAIAQQSSTNAIFLEIPKVTQSENSVDAKPDGVNRWVFEGELTKDDLIRYRWNAVSLDLRYKEIATVGAGYLKVYLNDDSQPENFITDFGSSPLPISAVADRLTPGENNLLLVYIDSATGLPAVPSTKVAFKFNYKDESVKPGLKVIEPLPGSLLADGVDQNFKIELENFQLSDTDTPKEGYGKMNVYNGDINEESLLGTIKSSSIVGDNKSLVEFSTKDIDFSKVSDGVDKKILFVLTDLAGSILPYQNEVILKANFSGSADVGLPIVTVVEPRKDRSNISMDGNQKIILDVANFEILDSFTEGKNEGGSGYLQIFVDNSPIKTIWPKLDFSLNEIGYYSEVEGLKNVKVQLVNKDFTKLSPEASDSFNLVYIPEIEQDETVDAQEGVQSDRWRVIIIILILIMIVGGISILVLKG